MRAYAPSNRKGTKGISGCRKSKDTPHRRRCLRVDKKTARAFIKKHNGLFAKVAEKDIDIPFYGW